MSWGLNVTINDIEGDYLVPIIWYTLSKIEENELPKLKQLLHDNLNNEEGLMTSVAQIWEDQGRAKGIAEGIEKGVEKGKVEGIAEGMEKRNIEIAKNMLVNGISVDLVSKTTGLSTKQVIDLNIGRMK